MGRHEAEAHLGAGEPVRTSDAEEEDDDIEVYAATEKERVARVAARRAARAAMRAGAGKIGGWFEPRRGRRERARGGPPSRRARTHQARLRAAERRVRRVGATMRRVA
jgi:hypothetical protein